MEIIKTGIVHRKTEGPCRYQAWPSLCIDENGVLYAVWSGDRSSHVCPFGKNLMSISRDGGEKWCPPIIVNDTWLDAWNNMPPHKPSILSTFLGKITRRISIDRWRKKHAGKRGGGEMDLVLDELEDCVSDPTDVEMVIEQQEMARVIREFLDGLGETERRIFLRRYWYMDSMAGIALEFDFTESKTASMLHRTRKKLRDKLESEGYL